MGTEMRTHLKGVVLTTGFLAFKPVPVKELSLERKGVQLLYGCFSFLPPYSVMRLNTFTPV